MSERGIRDKLVAVIDRAEEDHFQLVKQWVSERCPPPVPGHHRESVADAILSSPVIRRIQAEAFDAGAHALAASFWDGDAGVAENPYRDATSV